MARGALLHAAADGGSETIIRELLARKFDVNFKDRNGSTPLHRAAERGRPQAAALLIAHGARLDERTRAGESPYSLALAENNGEVTALLRSKGADQGPPRFPSSKGITWARSDPGPNPRSSPRASYPAVSACTARPRSPQAAGKHTGT